MLYICKIFAKTTTINWLFTIIWLLCSVCWLRNVVRATSTKTKFCQQKSIKHRCFGVVIPQLLRSPCLMKFSHIFVNWNVCIDQGNKRKEHRKIKIKHNHSKVCTLYTIFHSMVIGSFHQSLTSYFRRVCLYHSYTIVLTLSM